MSLYCSEVAVLHSAFALVEKQIGKEKFQTISKENCESPVKIVCKALEEIVHGLEEENTTEEQIQWQEKLHDMLLYKVCQSYDTNQPIIDENSVLDKTDMVTQIFPSFGIAFYTEIIKRCGWTTLFLSRLESLPIEIARDIFKDVLRVSSTDMNDSDITLMLELLDFVLSRLFTKSCDETFLSPFSEESTERSLIVSAIVTTLKHFQDYDLGKFYDNVSNENVIFHILCKKTLLQNFLLQLFLLGVISIPSENFNLNNLKRWFYLNIRGKEINFKDNKYTQPSLKFYKNSNLGKYSKTSQKMVVLDLDLESIQVLQKTFPLEMWTLVVTKLLHLEICKSVLDITQPDSVLTTIQLSKCPLQISMPDNTSDKSKIKSKKINLECSLSNLVAINFHIFSEHKSLTPEDLAILRRSESDIIDFDIETMIWRLEKRQPGFKDCIEELLKNKYTEHWTDSELMKTLHRNLDLLSVDGTLYKMYDIVVELESAVSQEDVLALVTSAFVRLPTEIRDRHIHDVYQKYRYWPKQDSVSSGEITAAFNKLTSCGPSSKVNDVYKQMLQNPELVLQYLVEQAITSKDQVSIHTEILKSVPSICKTCHHSNNHMTLLVYTLGGYLQTKTLTLKDQKNVLNFIVETCMPEEYLNDSGSLLDPVQFLGTSVLPYINVDNLYANSSPVTACFALEMFIKVVEAIPKMNGLKEEQEKKYIRKIFQKVNFPAVFFCLCELAHECIDLSDKDEFIASQKLKIKENLYALWFHLDNRNYIAEEFLRIEGEWLEKEMTSFDFTVQLLILGYIAPEKLKKTCDNICNDLTQSSDTNIVDILRMNSINETTQTVIRSLFDEVDLQLDPHSTVLALVQVLPSLVDGLWRNCLSFVGSMIYLENLEVRYKVQGQEVYTGYPSVLFIPLTESQLLYEVTTLLQYTDVPQNKLVLNNYLKSYVKFLKEYIVVEDEGKEEEKGFLLSEVFSHVVRGIWWMDDSDSDPCNVLLLDIVCSMEDMFIDSEEKRVLIQNIADCVHFIRNKDTRSMVNKKLKDILKNLYD
ncbi:gem associated protein 4 [Mytilus galloprovincialis]|uniref:Gem associated protein 4 n=1 Tax=Mytilus galloprovincialis TaxID=29158 RepID=A0A8B6GT46_MYTGA|nr:gem associated protein 4 [Mytilus galloprovincialis]